MKNKDNVLQWGEDKGIIAKSNPLKQAIKTLSEVEELLRAISNDDQEEVKDAYGDILVTIILGARLSGLDIEDCLQSAYDIISKRTGAMINGQFVKDK
jgi:NTP pyrophosphatase (non-canonical NTP hydrolase)